MLLKLLYTSVRVDKITLKMSPDTSWLRSAILVLPGTKQHNCHAKQSNHGEA